MGKLVLMGQVTKAKYLAIIDGSKFVPLDVPDDLAPEKRKAAFDSVGKIKNCVIEERRTYWWLPLDSFGQPDGNIETISLFPCDYRNLKELDFPLAYPYYWIFDNEYAAMRRAYD